MKKIFTFHGADHKCGCSMISQCVAERVAKECSDLSILLVHAEESANTGYSPRVGESMERIRPYLAERLLDVRDVVRKSEYKDNLYMIAGTSCPGSSESFHPDMAEFFLSAMTENFDIVICDSGANIEHGLSLGTLFASDSIYMVFEQSESAFKRYEWLQPLYSKLGLNIQGFIINKFTKQSAYTKEYVRKRLGVQREMVFTVHDSQYGSLAEIDEKSLLSYKDQVFRRDIDLIVADILSSAALTPDIRNAANG